AVLFVAAARPSVDDASIETGARDEIVVAEAAVDDVPTDAAHSAGSRVASMDVIVSGIAVEGVDASAAVEVIVAVAPIEHVVAVAAPQAVVADSTDKNVAS